MSDIVLLYPKTGNDVRPAIAPPHSLLSIASIPQIAGYKVKIIDQRVCADWRSELIKELATQPILVGVSTMTGTQIKFAIGLSKLVRELSQAPIVWGGRHPTLLPEQTLASGYMDIVCIGEGDYTLGAIADCIIKKRPLRTVAGIVYKNGNESCRTEVGCLPDMASLPLPAWNLINAEDYIHPDMYIKGSHRTMDVGMTSRGCPFNCGYCCQGRSKWRAMPADKSADMITEIVCRHRLDGMWIRDDEFYIDEKRVAQICEGILPLSVKWYTSGTRIDMFNNTPDDLVKLYQYSGASVLKFGAESGNNRVLQMIGKRITRENTIAANKKAMRFGMTPAYNFMAGFPSETLGEINDTIDLIKRLKNDNPSAMFETIMLYAPMPGTPMWETAISYGLKPPERLEDWIAWRFDESDDSGVRIPWFNVKDRKAIGNLCYLTSLVNVVPTIAASYNGDWRGKLFRMGYKLPHAYFNYRFNHKFYRHMPELGIIKKIREKVFYAN